ncbi:MAG: choice-of-anchor B family protein [Phycisphaerae bacterium]|nr:choice-of-anchor B family protein [Phycisphaerae bacterium]
MNHTRLALTAVLGVAGMAAGHSDDPKVNDRFGPFQGPGWIGDHSGGTAPLRSLGFTSSGDITMRSCLSLPDLGSPDTGNDCWGYVSPSGREYGLMGHSNGTAFIEVTNPASPIIVEQISGPNSLWRDIKVFGHHAYAVSEGGSGIQVIDMSNIDAGTVTLVNTVDTGGTSASHNVIINEDSGYLYRAGGGDNGLRIYDLNADPVNPPYVGSWNYKYVHDAQVVTFPFGSPYAGREVAFCCAGFNSGWNETGLTIVDVTNKSNIYIIAEMQHTNNNYSHQGWLTDDYQHFYLNDELDEQNTGSLTTTRIIDVSNLENPTQVGTCTSGSTSIDHNLYIKGNMMYQANYRSGIRIFDITDRLNPVQVSWFDTYPGSDSASFNGLWSSYPFFPSGTVIGSDLERGFFVWSVTAPSLEAELLDPTPSMLNPAGGDSFRISATIADGATYDSAASVLRWDDGTGWAESTLSIETPGNPMVLRATFGATECGSTVDFEAIVAATDGFSLTPASGFALSANDIVTSFEDNGETDPGWAVSGDATDGQWNRGIPAGGGDRGDPPSDADGSSRCWVTDNVAGNSDVDGGITILTSPALDATAADSVIEYWRWYSNDFGGGPNEDVFDVRVSDDNGGSWLLLEQVGPGGPEASGGWYYVQHDLASVSGLEPSSQFRVRFEASDYVNGSVVEAAVDGIRLSSIDCESCTGDIDGNGTVDVEDILDAIAGFGTDYDVDDILLVIGAFGTDC